VEICTLYLSGTAGLVAQIQPQASLRGADPLDGQPGDKSLYVFRAMSQSCSSSFSSFVRFSGDPSEPSAACFLRSFLFHPGKPASIPQPRTRTRTRTIGPLNTYKSPGYDRVSLRDEMKTGFQTSKRSKNAIGRFDFDDSICGPEAAILKKLF
jgi:hypothetical protein